jgi:capsular exopolysaccharide synthesis family protein
MDLARDTSGHPAALRSLEASEARRPSQLALQIDFVEFARILSRQKGIILGVAAVVMIVAVVVIYSLPTLYRATAYVEINPRQSKIVDFEAVLSGQPADAATMATEIQILRSRKLANKTVEKLGLDRDPEFNAALRAPGLLPRLLEPVFGVSLEPTVAVQDGEEGPAESEAEGGSDWSFGAILKRFIPRQDTAKSPPAGLKEQALRERSRVIDAFLKKLTATAQGRSRVIGVTVESANPRTAAASANTLADFYIVAQLEAKFEATRRASVWLSERILGLRDEVERTERAVERYREKSGLIQGGANATLTAEQVSELNRQFVTDRARLAEAEARLYQVKKVLAEPGGIESTAEVLNSQLIRDLRREESRVERLVAELSNEYGEQHPRMINARAELNDVRNKIESEVAKIVQGLRNEVAVVRARTGSLSKALRDLKGEVARLNTSEVQLRALEREATASRDLLEQLLARSKETGSQENFQEADANIISRAAFPKSPSLPKKTLLISTAMALEYLDFGFRSTEQVQRLLGLVPLGLVPTLRGLKTFGTQPQNHILDNPGSAYSESIRNLYTSLLLLDVMKRPTVILFASALPNEGKTSVVLSLGRLQASVGQSVVVVDCDLRRPTAHTGLGIPAGPGLVECLAGQVQLDQVLQKDPRSELHLLRAGATPPNPADLFDSVQMQKLLRGLARQYDLVLLDSAPMMAVSDTLFLSHLVDKTALVVRWEKTPRETVKLVMNRVLDAGSEAAGVLLSRVDVKEHAKYSYADSGHYHGELKRYYSS